ncbi:hypothetical protein MICAF_4720001 [Microcystis aeruginosa PCC 9807]|uniref:Uncharacterized protein n=1 Tax=Microcystis aeruginosa PCC 9807 TaxID=1160283 RepID=I4HAT0_MICAE|nr:hypothetical protein MICAF_4720001 [Microcystis aeruginosa PCC 9807]
MAQGGYFGGHSFYIYQGKLCYVYNWLGQQQKITCDLPRLSSEVTLKVEFAKPKIIAPSDEKLGDSTIDNMKLYKYLGKINYTYLTPLLPLAPCLLPIFTRKLILHDYLLITSNKMSIL